MICRSIQLTAGFIAQFGTVRDAKGALQLDANYVGLWGAINYVAQAAAQFGSPFTAQRFGIRANMWLFTGFKLIVSRLIFPGLLLITDHHHRDLQQELVALFDRQSNQWPRCRIDRNLSPVLRF